jgi:hypothetical protein
MPCHTTNLTTPHHSQQSSPRLGRHACRPHSPTYAIQHLQIDHATTGLYRTQYFLLVCTACAGWCALHVLATHTPHMQGVLHTSTHSCTHPCLRVRRQMAGAYSLLLRCWPLQHCQDSQAAANASMGCDDLLTSPISQSQLFQAEKGFLRSCRASSVAGCNMNTASPLQELGFGHRSQQH